MGLDAITNKKNPEVIADSLISLKSFDSDLK